MSFSRDSRERRAPQIARSSLIEVNLLGSQKLETKKGKPEFAL
jgi:hypothetical protein